MSIFDLITEIKQAGGELTVSGDKLRYRIPVDAASQLVPRIRRAKPEILEALRDRPSHVGVDGVTCGSLNCAGCYVVDEETGARVHPPKSSSEWLAWSERCKSKGKLR